MMIVPEVHVRTMSQLLQRVGLAAGLSPIVLLPMLAACDSEAEIQSVSDSDSDGQIPDDVVPLDEVPDADVSPAAQPQYTAPQDRNWERVPNDVKRPGSGTATVDEPDEEPAEPDIPVQKVWPSEIVLHSEAIPDHVNNVDLNNVVPGAHVSVWFGSVGGTTNNLPVGDATLLTEFIAGEDGFEGLRGMIPNADAAGEPYLDNQDVAFVVLLETADGQVAMSAVETKIAVITPTLAADELHPGFDTSTLAAGDRMRACLPMSEWGSCPAVEDFTPWQALELTSFAIDQSLPSGLTVDACIEDTAYEGDCCYMVEFWDPMAPVPATLCTAPDGNRGNGGGGGGGGGGWWYAGRPFASEEGRTEAPVLTSSSWSTVTTADATADLQVPEDLREAVASAWQDLAKAEHASVASFARFTMELMALGAPAHLVASATQAQADEIRHAELAFAIASAVSGAPVGPGPFLPPAGYDRSNDVEAILVAAIVEGCISETVSAMQVAEGAKRTASPALAARLHEVADDESRHAELSWAFVRWLLTERPDLAPVARAAFDGFRPSDAPAPSADLSAWGVLPDDVASDLANTVLERVIRPAADALLGTIAEA